MSFVTTTLYFFFLIVEIILAIYLVIPFFLLVSYLFIRLLGIKTPESRRPFIYTKDFDFGIIVTAHQESEFIWPLIDSLLKQDYTKFRVYVVADDCEGDFSAIKDERVEIIKPAPALHSKIKSIQHGLSQFTGHHDAVIIFDSDNLIHPSFMSVMNRHFQKGYKVVQADFKPKNVDSNYARMDAIGDMFNFFIEREARMRLNLSSAIWGSGIAFDLALYNGISYKDQLGGLDKKLQSHFVMQVDRIAFAPDAILFDEKIASGKSLENQRTRWIHSYFKYFKDSFTVFMVGLKRMNVNLTYFGFILMRPPLFMVIGGGLICCIINYFLNLQLFYAWLIILGSFVVSFFAIVYIKSRDWRFLTTIFLIPVFVLRQIMALLKIKKAKKSFIKTTHTKLMYIDDLM